MEIPWCAGEPLCVAYGHRKARSGRHEIAREYFRAALPLARNPMERRFLEQRIGACDAPLRSRYRSARQTVPFRRVVKRERFGPNMTLLGMRDEAART